jgi:peptide deformylase
LINSQKVILQNHQVFPMAVKKIITYPHPVLRQKTKEVTVFDDDLRQLVADMIETMYAAPGVGLAANQIGVSLQVVVIDITAGKEEKKQQCVYVNPEILQGEGTQVGEEGCLSVVDFSADVKRFKKIKVRAQDLDGNTEEFEAEDRFARIIQHEVDHLNGILFIDHISSLKRTLYKRRLKKELKRL